MLKILISGALGKMGKSVYEIAKNSAAVVPACGVDVKTVFSGKDFPIFSTFAEADELINKGTLKVDVIIDFSSPAVLDGLLNFAEKHAVPAVLCTTGYSKEQIKKITRASETIAIFNSANMSLGINVLRAAVKLAAEKLCDFDAEIIEAHHSSKKDAPSGTALMLADCIKRSKKDARLVFGRNGGDCKRDKREIGIHSVRGGNVVGKHTVMLCGENETVTLSHEATDKSVFAAGAIKAALFIADKKRGLFDMNDLLKD